MDTDQLVVNLKNMQIFQNDTQVLRDVNLEVKRRDFIYIIGRTGSGKSSFLKTLYGDLNFNSADVARIAGYDLNDLKTSDIPMLRRKIGIVFQDFQLLTDRNVEENLRFVLEATGWKEKGLIQSKINDMLSLVKLEDKQKKMPYQLSGGEQQRIVVARALLNDPKIILADEPTGNLDPRTTDDIMNLLFNINKELGTPVIMATHNYQLIDKFPGTVYICANQQLKQGIEIPSEEN
ncbi:MAG TPA: ATP-binding cassette domain-containing protein [Chitinophagales bacterium]|nr:ATP-binding cassette domain-containing protein [Chitinophagales bacterium]